jgi:hypothetical protein
MFIAFLSCKKNKGIIDQPVVKPDHILYTDIADTTLTSIDSMQYIGSDDYGDCYQYFPEESEQSIQLDINNDGVNDFEVTHSHWYGTEQWSPHCWCNVYRNFQTQIQGINNSRILVKYTTCLRFGENLTIGDTIDSTARYSAPPNPGWQWDNDANLYLYSTTAMCSGYPESEYIGVSITKNDSVYYGWLRIFSDQNAFTVKAYAVNLTPGNCILVGQTE